MRRLKGLVAFLREIVVGDAILDQYFANRVRAGKEKLSVERVMDDLRAPDSVERFFARLILVIVILAILIAGTAFWVESQAVTSYKCYDPRYGAVVFRTYDLHWFQMSEKYWMDDDEFSEHCVYGGGK